MDDKFAELDKEVSKALDHILNNSDYSAEDIGKLLFDATKRPMVFTRQESEEIATGRRRLFEIPGGKALYIAEVNLNSYQNWLSK